MEKTVDFIRIYSNQGCVKALWSLLRLFVLPYSKIDQIISKSSVVIDVGCGAGVLSNYLSISSKRRKIIGIDTSKSRIESAEKTIGARKNISFINGDVTKTIFPKVDCYLVVDVLHHIPYKKHRPLIKSLVEKMDKQSVIIIKEVNPSDKLHFLFGHIFEKILYPKEQIFTRKKTDWIKMLKNENLECEVFKGNFYFPDSTVIYKCSLK